MKMAEKYLHVQTNQLRPLIEHLYGDTAWETNTWKNLGSSANAINLDDIDGANMIQVDSDGDMVMETHYILPIVDEVKANTFRVDCGKLDLEVDIMTAKEAIKLWKEYKNISKEQREKMSK